MGKGFLHPVWEVFWNPSGRRALNICDVRLLMELVYIFFNYFCLKQGAFFSSKIKLLITNGQHYPGFPFCVKFDQNFIQHFSIYRKSDFNKKMWFSLYETFQK